MLTVFHVTVLLHLEYPSVSLLKHWSVKEAEVLWKITQIRFNVFSSFHYTNSSPWVQTNLCKKGKYLLSLSPVFWAKMQRRWRNHVYLLAGMYFLSKETKAQSQWKKAGKSWAYPKSEMDFVSDAFKQLLCRKVNYKNFNAPFNALAFNQSVFLHVKMKVPKVMSYSWINVKNWF